MANCYRDLTHSIIVIIIMHCIPCFDAVGWVAGRASGLQKTEWWGAGVVICLERGADLHMAQLMPLPFTVCCFSEIQTGFTFWYWFTWVVPDKGQLNGFVHVIMQRLTRHLLVIRTTNCSLHTLGTLVSLAKQLN